MQLSALKDRMVLWSNTIENVLSRIYLEGIAYNGKAPQLYWDAKEALEQLDKTCLTVNSTTDPYCPLNQRIENYPIIVVGKNKTRLKFSYTKKQLSNGEVLIVVEEVANAYGRILTENYDSKQIIRLTKSELRAIIKESVRTILKEHTYNRLQNIY